MRNMPQSGDLPSGVDISSACTAKNRHLELQEHFSSRIRDPECLCWCRNSHSAVHLLCLDVQRLAESERHLEKEST